MTDKSIQESLDDLGASIDKSNKLILKLRLHTAALSLALKWALNNMDDNLDLDAQETKEACKKLMETEL